MDGEDKDYIDYTIIDTNEKYDDAKQIERD